MPSTSWRQRPGSTAWGSLGRTGSRRRRCAVSGAIAAARQTGRLRDWHDDPSTARSLKHLVSRLLGPDGRPASRLDEDGAGFSGLLGSISNGAAGAPRTCLVRQMGMGRRQHLLLWLMARLGAARAASPADLGERADGRCPRRVWRGGGGGKKLRSVAGRALQRGIEVDRAARRLRGPRFQRIEARPRARGGRTLLPGPSASACRAVCRSRRRRTKLSRTILACAAGDGLPRLPLRRGLESPQNRTTLGARGVIGRPHRTE